MYKLCKTERSAQRQRKIEEALLTLMTQENYADISVTGICEAMEMPRKAFYRYFDSKEDALQALIDHTLIDFEKKTPALGGGKRSLSHELEQFFIFWQEKRVLMDTLDRNGLMGRLLDTCVSYPVKDGALLAKFLASDEEWMRPHIIKFTASGLFTLMLEWYREGYACDTKRMAELACRMLREPLFPTLGALGFTK